MVLLMGPMGIVNFSPALAQNQFFSTQCVLFIARLRDLDFSYKDPCYAKAME